jgi:hypothetical protein
MAQLAGFELEARPADWAGADFTAESRSHVSVYRLLTASGFSLDELPRLADLRTP